MKILVGTVLGPQYSCFSYLKTYFAQNIYEVYHL